VTVTTKPPFDQIIVLDFETAWCKKTYTLSKMTTEEYVRDKRFKAWGLCWKIVGSESVPEWLSREEIQGWADSIDWSRTAVLAHNAQFDVTVLSWVYGVDPCFIFDTLSMARALRGVEVGNSLAKLAADFGLPPKGNAVHSTDGMLKELAPEVEAELAEYCAHDTYLCEEIFKRLQPGYPVKEMRLIDMTLRMYTRPLLELDQNMLVDALLEEKESREDLLKRLNVSDEVLASNPQFAQLLISMGCEPPTKISKTTGQETYALAKNDALFQALLNGDREDVALLCEARLRVKSTTERTRAQRFLDIAKRGALPVPLSYYGAATGRWTASKGSAINMQNLKRGSFLRKAIMAPEGHQLIVADLSQIEPRVLAWLADYDDMLDIFKAKGDPYAQFGAQMFNIPGLSKESHPDLRQSAKSALLGCGYQLGWASFAAQLLVGFLGAPPVRYDKPFAKQLGVNGDALLRFIENEKFLDKMSKIPHTCTQQQLVVHCVAAKKIIDIYRQTAYPVVSFWELCGALIERSLADGEEYTHKCLLFRKEEIVLPNGMSIRYPNLRQEKTADGGRSWVYGPDATKLYAGKITNNVTQGTARVVMTDGMLRIAKRYPVVGTVHDECIAVAPDAEATKAFEWMLEQMTLEPSYMPGIPLAADGGVHRRYGSAKQ
jgi:hypothetical protein